MTQPTTEVDPAGTDDALIDALAEELLADAVADLDTTPDLPPPAGGGQPDMGATTPTPDMGESVTQPTPQPAPTPTAGAGTTAPAPAQPAPPTTAPAPPAEPTGQGPATGTDPDGYPAGTPVAEMTIAQQAAYWKHQARKHEQRVKDMGDYDDLRKTADAYKQLVDASQTEHERAVAEARQQGAAEALRKAGGDLVEQWMRAAIGTRLPEDRVNTLLDGLDRTRFIDQNGRVDTAKVQTYADTLIPATTTAAPAATSVPEAGAQPAAPTAQPTQPQSTAPPRGLDFGQGQPARARPSGLEAGRELARQRFGKPPATSPTTATS